MADVRLTVCRRRPVEKRIRFAPAPERDALLEDLMLLPKGENLLLARNKIQFARYLLVHASLFSLLHGIKK
ncbi:hypothetical protein SDC9_80503 [bioreactor metagenome]|uniref:Uncharacterized protein n=1 Tax=bioreactor metagenome TaxID=1076179 RepID=A0A644YZM2_9ZZZZ